MLDDTIVAISTALGEGGIGIIRVSGAQAKELVDKLFYSPKGKNIMDMDTYTLRYGFIVDSETNERLDEVIVSYFKAPYSFTGEDVIEVNCHGGMIPLRRVLMLINNHGARLADPGEFTKRAFINGKLDLAQAEAVIDIIRSKTDMGLKVAMQQLEGGLSQKVRELKHILTETLAFIEAGIDFPDEDLEEISGETIASKVKLVINGIDVLLEGATTGRIIREGVSAVIVGKPNVGKSSLLNALLKEKRAIVTEIPGTTRDVIEEVLNIKGIPVRLIDTAGIRETGDVVEKIGVAKSKEKIELADLVLLVLDATTGIQEFDREIIELAKNKNTIVVINKTDLAIEQDLSSSVRVELEDAPIVRISVKQGEGIGHLEKTIYDLLLEGKVSPNDAALVSNLRHIEILRKAKQHLEAVLGGVELEMAGDFLSIDLTAAWQLLGEISGETINEDLLDQIFSKFCIGK